MPDHPASPAIHPMMLRYLIPLCLLAAPLVATPRAVHAQAPAGAPAGAPANAPTAAAEEGAQRPVRQSWTSPRRTFAVGDVVTVLVDEYTLASANTGNTAVDNRRRELGLDGGFDMAASGMSARANVRTSNNAQSTQRGEAVRQNRFQSEMSVRIVEVDPATGLLRLEGTKLVDVDKNRQEIAFSGFARPQDISAQNMVESWRVADAKLEYVAKGSLGKPKGSILGRVLGMVWP